MLGMAQAQGPEPAVVGGTEHGVHRLPVQATGGGAEQRRVHLRRVPRDDQRGQPRAGEILVSGGQPGGQAVAALGHHVPGRRHRMVPFEQQHPAGRRRGADGRDQVVERGGGQAGGGLRRVRRAQPGLDRARHRRLRDHRHLRPGHRASTFAMSRTARAVPRTVPVTLERVPAARGR